MFYQYDSAQKAPESTAEWLRIFREVPQLPQILKRFYPDLIDQERLMNRAGDYLTRYAAWETVRLGRACLVVGNPHASYFSGPLPFTGFEGYLVGTNLTESERIHLIAQTGSHFEKVGHLVFGEDSMENIDEFLNGDLHMIDKFSDETLKSLLISADTLFNWVRHQLKYHLERDEQAYEAFRASTREPLLRMPESYYRIAPISHRVYINVPLPRAELVRQGEPYDLVFNAAEGRGYAFMLTLAHAASPLLAAAAQDILDPLEHEVELYY